MNNNPSPTHSYNSLKLFAAQQSAPPAATPQETSGKQTVEQATKGMSEVEKFNWVQAQLEKTIQDMEKAGIKVDRTKFMYTNFSAGPYFDPTTRTINMGGLPPGTTVEQMRAYMVHEVTHSQMPEPRNFKERQAGEAAGDHNMARTYGAQAAIDALENLVKGDPQEAHRRRDDHGHKDEHGSIRDRQHKITHEFPNENAIIPEDNKSNNHKATNRKSTGPTHNMYSA